MRQAILTVRDDGSALGVEGALAVFRAAGLTGIDVLSCEGASGVVRVGVEEAIDEGRLTDLETVEWFEEVADPGPGRAYLVGFDAREGTACDDELLHCRAVGADDRGFTVDLAGPQAAIGDTVAGYEDAGADVALETLRDYERRERPRDALTTRQQEVLRAAYDLGYFDVPREASTAAVAAELDLDDSTVAEHLQRAERNLVSAVLE